MKVVGLMSRAIGDFTEGEFLKCEPIIDNENYQEILEKQHYLSGGSLLAHSSKAALLLAGFSDLENCDLAFNIGKHIGIAFEVSQNHFKHIY